MKTADYRRAREYAAGLLLLAAAVQVLIGAWALSGLRGGPGFGAGSGFVAGGGFLPGGGFGPPIGLPLWARAQVAFPNLVEFTVTVLPVAAVLLVAMPRRSRRTAPVLIVIAVIIQTVALALGLVAWVSFLSKADGWSLISYTVDIVVALAGLILTVAVLRARAADLL